MAVLPIRTFGDPALRQKAEPVERITDLHHKLIADMFDTMRQAPGVGLAGPQVGVLERIFVWEAEDRHGVLINPMITERSEETVQEEEGCLSLPGIYYPVARASQVTVEGLDENGERVVLEGSDLLARIFQHEIDHLDGVLFIDHLDGDMRKEALAKLREQALGISLEPLEDAPREELL
jgi:peptide deformylase